jgi:methyl-accepting chemotaxis protein
MRNGKKKEPHIDKLTRQQLITKCRGRGIAIGQYLAKIKRLEADLASCDGAQTTIAKLEEEIKLWMRRCVTHEDDAMKSQNLLNQATDTIADQDKNIDALCVTFVELRDQNGKQAEAIEQLTASNNEFRESWHSASARAEKAEEHARELAEFFLVNIGQVINTSKLIVVGLKSIEAKYKEE